MLETRSETAVEDPQMQVVHLLSLLVDRAFAPAPPKYLTVEEAAAYCRVAVQTLYNHRRHIERLPGVRKLLFTRDALDRWLAQRQRKKRERP